MAMIPAAVIHAEAGVVVGINVAILRDRGVVHG